MFLFTISPPLGSQAPLKKSHLSAKLKSQWTPFCITESIANTANNVPGQSAGGCRIEPPDHGLVVTFLWLTVVLKYQNIDNQSIHKFTLTMGRDEKLRILSQASLLDPSASRFFSSPTTLHATLQMVLKKNRQNCQVYIVWNIISWQLQFEDTHYRRSWKNPYVLCVSGSLDTRWTDGHSPQARIISG